MGDRVGRRTMPRTGAGADVQDFVQARQKRARVQGRGRGSPRHPHSATGVAAKVWRDYFALPVPLETLFAGELPQGHRLSGHCRAHHRRGWSAAVICAGILYRRFGNHRDRRCAVGARSGQWHHHTGHSHCRARLGYSAGRRSGPPGPRPPVYCVHAGLQGHHVARRAGANLYAAGGARLPGALAVFDAGRGIARNQGPRIARGAGHHRPQPAPRPTG